MKRRSDDERAPLFANTEEDQQTLDLTESRGESPALQVGEDVNDRTRADRVRLCERHSANRSPIPLEIDAAQTVTYRRPTYRSMQNIHEQLDASEQQATALEADLSQNSGHSEKNGAGGNGKDGSGHSLNSTVREQATVQLTSTVELIRLARRAET